VLIDVARLSRAHCLYVLLQNFTDGVEWSRGEYPRLYSVLKTLRNLFALYYIERDLGEFMEDGYFAPAQAELLRQCVKQLLSEVTHHALQLVDAFNFADVQLKSAVGAFDGNVYERLYNWAQKEPLNTSHVTSVYYKYMKPIMQQQVEVSKL
jgi:hypothetical protein